MKRPAGWVSALISCFVMLLTAAHAQAAAPVATLKLCGATFSPKREMQKFTDANITTQLWRDVVTACNDTLVLDWWLYDAQHWSVTVRRVVANYSAERRDGIAVTAQLVLDGKPVPSPQAALSGKLFEMQVGYVEAYRVAPRLRVVDMIKQRKLPPINMFRAPVQMVFVDGNYNFRPYTSLGSDKGTLERGMAVTGERADLGLVHEWCAAYISYQDIHPDTWWRFCTDAALDSANVPWHVARTDGLPTLWDDPAFKGKGFDERNVQYGPTRAVRSPTASGWSLDDAHQPFAQLVPYMLTRHPYFLWLAQFQAAALIGAPNCPVEFCERDTPQGPTLPMKSQLRGAAWSFRTLSQTILMTPESVPGWLWPRARYQDVMVRSDARWRAAILQPSAQYWQALAENLAAKLRNVEGCGVVKVTARVSCGTQMWMYDFWGQAVGFAKWAGVAGLEDTNRLLNAQMIYRYGPGSPIRRLGSPFTMVFSNPLSATPQIANSREDVLRWTPSENLQYGSNRPLVVGAPGQIGQFTETFWQVQGNAAFCALNGNAQCREIARYWQSEWERLKAAQPSWLGGWEFAKYRIAVD